MDCSLRPTPDFLVTQDLDFSDARKYAPGTQLRQENGYFVLRFLAEDVGEDLDTVLDAVLRALSRRRGSPSMPVAIVRPS